MSQIKPLFHGLLAVSQISSLAAGVMIFNADGLDRTRDIGESDEKKLDYMRMMGAAMVTASVLNLIYIFLFFRNEPATYKTLSLATCAISFGLLLGCVVMIAMLGDKFNHGSINKGVISAVSIAFAINIGAAGYTIWKRDEMIDVGSVSASSYSPLGLPPQINPATGQPIYVPSSNSGFFLY